MPKSINTTANTQTMTNRAPATFKAGDSVLCPSVGSRAYTLFHDKNHDCLGFTANGKTYHYRTDGKVSRDDCQPSLFHDTPANRQAVATLFNMAGTPSRKVIDTSADDDKEVIVVSAFGFSHIADDIYGAINVINDIGHLLGLIHYKKIDGEAAKSMARLAHDATCTWSNILTDQLESINKTLAKTRFGKVGDL